MTIGEAKRYTVNMNKNHLYPKDLTEHQWECIKDLIPPAKPGGRPRTLEMCALINAILYVVVNGRQ
jgi:putative transposase